MKFMKYHFNFIKYFEFYKISRDKAHIDYVNFDEKLLLQCQKSMIEYKF